MRGITCDVWNSDSNLIFEFSACSSYIYGLVERLNVEPICIFIGDNGWRITKNLKIFSSILLACRVKLANLEVFITNTSEPASLDFRTALENYLFSLGIDCWLVDNLLFKISLGCS